MAIYDLYEEKSESIEEPLQKPVEKGRLLSSLGARSFFLVLLIADLLWAVYSIAFLLGEGVLMLLTWFTVPALKKSVQKRFLNLRRSAMCGISLLVALFSPSMGTMIACTYFLMYDRAGIEEVVPSSLQQQFKEYLR